MLGQIVPGYDMLVQVNSDEAKLDRIFLF